jgi:hypothetical protein
MPEGLAVQSRTFRARVPTRIAAAHTGCRTGALKNKKASYALAFLLRSYPWIETLNPGGRCKFRTCDPSSVNAVLYP